MIKAGIIGGAGYTAGELIRLLIHHKQTTIDFVYSTSNAGNKVYKVHQDLVGSTEMEFTSDINGNVDVLFLCLGHGNSKAFLRLEIYKKLMASVNFVVLYFWGIDAFLYGLVVHSTFLPFFLKYFDSLKLHDKTLHTRHIRNHSHSHSHSHNFDSFYAYKNLK